jgi:hypothetical protein
MMPVPEIALRLEVRDLGPGDLESCGRAGTTTHLAAIARALERARLGEVEYLAACPPSGLPPVFANEIRQEVHMAADYWIVQDRRV